MFLVTVGHAYGDVDDDDDDDGDGGDDDDGDDGDHHLAICFPS